MPATDIVLQEVNRASCRFSEGERAYQTLCEDLELVLGYEVLLSKHTYKNQSALKCDGSVLGLTIQVGNSIPRSVDDPQDRVLGVIHLVIGKGVFSGETDPFQVSLQSKI